MQHRGKKVSAKPANMVREQINPFEDLWVGHQSGAKSSPISIRLTDTIATKIDYYTHDDKYPWKSRSDFLQSAAFRLLEDIQRVEAHPLFDDSLKGLKLIHLQLAAQEEGKRTAEACEKITANMRELLADGDIAEAKRLYSAIVEIAEKMVNPRRKEKILVTVRAYAKMFGGGE